jgi:hypothetical protein
MKRLPGRLRQLDEPPDVEACLSHPRGLFATLPRGSGRRRLVDKVEPLFCVFDDGVRGAVDGAVPTLPSERQEQS